MVKLVLYEPGSDTADELWSGAAVRFASRLVYPEGRAALAAAERARRIDPAALRLAAIDLERACAAMQLIGVDAELAGHAGELAERHALRGYDAVHLATALAVNEPDVVVVTWDRDLADAAVRSGRPIAPASTAR